MFNFLKKKKIPFRDPKDFDGAMIEIETLISILQNSTSENVNIKGVIKILKRFIETIEDFAPEKSNTYKKQLSNYLRIVNSHPVK